MDSFLLKIIDKNDEDVWNDKFKLRYSHLENFKNFANKNNLSISLSTDDAAALSLAVINYISILNLKTGYLIFLPEICSESQIDYLEKVLPFYI